LKKLYLKSNPALLAILFIPSLMFMSCRSMPEKDEMALVYYNLGNAYSELGRSTDAGDAYERAFALNPSLVKAGYNLGRIRVETGRYKEGIKIFEDLLQQDPGNSLVMSALAWAYYKNGDSSKAITLYKAIMEEDPVNKDALYNSALLMSFKGDYGDAYPYLKKLDALEEADSYIYKYLGIAEKELEISSGTLWLEKAAESKPGDAEILNLLAEAYNSEKRYTEAVETYDKLLSIHKTGDLLFKKARILLVYIEDYDTGLPVLEEALTQGLSDSIKLSTLIDYPDLLYPDRIKTVVKKIEKSKASSGN